MQVPIVTLWKAGKPVDFNASKKSEFLSQGWTEAPGAVKPVEKPVKAEKKPKGFANG